jgi:hypothetical protein
MTMALFEKIIMALRRERFENPCFTNKNKYKQ